MAYQLFPSIGVCKGKEGGRKEAILVKEHLGQVVENVSQVINIWDKNLCSESQKLYVYISQVVLTYSFIHQIFIEYLLCARHCPRCWR